VSTLRQAYHAVRTYGPAAVSITLILTRSLCAWPARSFSQSLCVCGQFSFDH